MRTLLSAVADHLAALPLAAPIVWENVEAAPALPRIELRLGPRTARAVSFSGLARVQTQIILTVVVGEGQGQDLALSLCEDLQDALAVGTRLATAQVGRPLEMGAAQARAGRLSRTLLLFLDTLTCA